MENWIFLFLNLLHNIHVQIMANSLNVIYFETTKSSIRIFSRTYDDVKACVIFKRTKLNFYLQEPSFLTNLYLKSVYLLCFPLCCVELCTKYFFWLEKDYFLAFLLEYFVILMPEYICFFIKGEQIRPGMKEAKNVIFPVY